MAEKISGTALRDHAGEPAKGMREALAGNLYEALAEAIAAYEVYDESEAADARINAALEAARAALAKARGNPPATGAAESGSTDAVDGATSNV